MEEKFPTLVLPKRFEALQEEVKTRAADISRIVHRVDEASTRVETLLRQVRDGRLGRFEVFLGKSGSGKTTFFSTLTQFFKGVAVHKIEKSVPLESIAEYIEKFKTDPNPSLWFVHDRDNPNVSSSDAMHFAESLRPFFRVAAGRIVLIWPITEQSSAEALSQAAWTIGRDSLVDVTSKGLFHFRGIDKSQYYEIADLTVRNLTPAQTLETFGLTRERSGPLIAESDTIGEFYSRLESESQRINQSHRDILKQRAIPRLWILVAGDSNQDLNMTIASLTQGRERQVDIDRVLSFLDDDSKDTAYMKDWQRRRNDVAFLLRRFDVRIFELPPNAALAAVRLFGDDSAKHPLKLKSAAKASGVEAIRKTAFSRALNGSERLPGPPKRQTDSQTADEYRRIQNIAPKNDNRFNKALAEALLESSTPEVVAIVSSEKKLEEGNLKPDIYIEMADGDVICLEITWRTTGKGINEEIERRQNTLSVGHIQKYLLDKVMEYVKEYDL